MWGLYLLLFSTWIVTFVSEGFRPLPPARQRGRHRAGRGCPGRGVAGRIPGASERVTCRVHVVLKNLDSGS